MVNEKLGLSPSNGPSTGANYPCRPLRGASGTGDINEISGQVVDTAFQIHAELGPGLFESVYETLLASRLARRGLAVERQRPVPVTIDGLYFDEAFRADLVVEGRLIVEVKSVEHLQAVHLKQVLTYVRLLDFRLGLLINFGAPLIKDGIRRVVNRL